MSEKMSPRNSIIGDTLISIYLCLGLALWNGFSAITFLSYFVRARKNAVRPMCARLIAARRTWWRRGKARRKAIWLTWLCYAFIVHWSNTLRSQFSSSLGGFHPRFTEKVASFFGISVPYTTWASKLDNGYVWMYYLAMQYLRMPILNF